MGVRTSSLTSCAPGAGRRSRICILLLAAEPWSCLSLSSPFNPIPWCQPQLLQGWCWGKQGLWLLPQGQGCGVPCAAWCHGM